MKKFYEIGDIHFSAINPWNFQAGEKFIEWFDKQDFGNKEDIEFGFAGDIAERDTNPGLVVDQIDRFFNIVSKKAKHVYVTVGNHDKKLYHDVEQHSLYFLENKGNITVVDKEKEIITENGFDVLFLPHQRINNMSLIDYYNNLPKDMTSKKYDIIFGHWAIKQESGLEYMRNGVDISQLKAISYAIGHVHLRIRDEYLGSVWPNSEPEYDPKRPHGYKVLDENRNETFVEFPEFLAYKKEEFGKEIKSNDKVIVYTITNCNSLTEARNKYPDIYIKDIERPLAELGYDVSDTDDDVKTVAGGYVNDLSKAFDEMISEEKLEITRRTYSLCKTLLKEKE